MVEKFLLSATFLAVIVTAFAMALNRPVMYVSDVTGACMYAEGPQGKILCGDIKKEDLRGYDRMIAFDKDYDRPLVPLGGESE